MKFEVLRGTQKAIRCYDRRGNESIVFTAKAIPTSAVHYTTVLDRATANKIAERFDGIVLTA
jgi:hypothetical protein